ncbi:MAG: tetratricopeptide repeat protein, partial [Gemmatimonadales bacterium]
MLRCTLLLLGLSTPLAAQGSPADKALEVARSGKADSALSLLVKARAADPENLDLQLAHARVLGWAGRRGEAESVYDSVLARSPANVDAVVGLGYVYHWQGREGAAMRQAETALALDSANADAQALRRVAHSAGRVSMQSSADWSNDSDHNTGFWQTHSVSVPLIEGLRILAAAAVLEASDPLRDAWRYG